LLISYTYNKHLVRKKHLVKRKGTNLHKLKHED
jgi:hypothetical protein